MARSSVTYDSNRPRWAFYSDAYWGGEFWRTPSSATLGTATLWLYAKDEETGHVMERPGGTVQSYLVPFPGERPSAFSARHSLAVYINPVAPIVDAYTNAVTRGVTRNLGALAPYLRNLDGQGQDWGALVTDWARYAALYGFCGLVLDAPASNPAANRAAEETSGVGFRATLVQPPAIAWVEADPATGALLEFAFVQDAYADGGAGDSARRTVQLWVYDRTVWRQYSCEVDTAKPLSSQRGGVLGTVPTAEGAHSWPGQVPVRFAYFRQNREHGCPFGVSLVSDIADIARQIYNKLSSVDDVHRKTAFPFLAIPTKSAGGQLAPETKVEIGPDKALGYPSDTGVPQWVQPSAEQTKELRDHSVFLLAMAYRIAGIEVGVDGTAGLESGLAIQLKSTGFDRMASTFAGSIEQGEAGALALAAQALQQPTPADLTVYPTKFVLPDLSEDLARALLLIQSLGDKLGAEGQALAIGQALASALNLPDATLARVMLEVRRQLGITPPAPGAPAGGGA